MAHTICHKFCADSKYGGISVTDFGNCHLISQLSDIELQSAVRLTREHPDFIASTSFVFQ